MRTSEILDLAADTIQCRGWADATRTPNPWGTNRSDSPVCIEGAILAAAGYRVVPEFGVATPRWVPEVEMTTCPGYTAMIDYLEPELGLLDSRLFHWNDAQGRTKNEVIEALRGAAAVERAKEESLESEQASAYTHQ